MIEKHVCCSKKSDQECQCNHGIAHKIEEGSKIKGEHSQDGVERKL